MAYSTELRARWTGQGWRFRSATLALFSVSSQAVYRVGSVVVTVVFHSKTRKKIVGVDLYSESKKRSHDVPLLGVEGCQVGLHNAELLQDLFLVLDKSFGLDGEFCLELGTKCSRVVDSVFKDSMVLRTAIVGRSNI